jgi:hypothetical protein
LTPNQIETYKKLGKMTVFNILNNSIIPVDFSDENISIERINLDNGRFSEG